MTRTAATEWRSDTSRTNEKGEPVFWFIEIQSLIKIELSYKEGKWAVTSGTLSWFPRSVLKATTLEEAKPAAVRVVQAFLKKNLAALDHLNK